MKLDWKYGLIRKRRLEQIRSWDGGDGEVADQRAVEDAIKLLERAGVIDWGDTPETEFFAIRLRDENAQAALFGYSGSAARKDLEYAGEIAELGSRSGPAHPNCKAPD